LEIIISSLNLIFPVGLDYLFKLAIDQNRCKTDVYIHHFIVAAFGIEATDEKNPDFIDRSC
jgi:hypothetical protein